MENTVELNSLLLKLFCYITWLDERRNWRTCKRGIFFKFYCFFIHVDLTWILRRYVEDQISTNFDVICMNFFNIISLIENSTSFPHTFFDVISMVEKSALFPRTFLDVILMVEKSTL